MAKAFHAEFRRDVVAVARKREAPFKQIAKDFGVSEASLHNWLRQADIEEGVASSSRAWPGSASRASCSDAPSSNC